MRNKIYQLLLLLLFFNLSVVIADTIELNPERPEQYIVKKGDTLWDIAGHFIQDHQQWRVIWKNNPQIKNPHLIYPGNKVTLIFENGQPALVVNGVSPPEDSEVVDSEAADSKVLTVERDIKLSPKIRTLKRHDSGVKVVPFHIVQQFLVLALVVDENEMNSWPYVVSNYEGHLISSEGERVYIRGIDKATTNTHYSVYREGDRYINPLKDKRVVLGYEAIYIGDLVIEKYGDPASAILTSLHQEVLQGDRLRPKSDENVLTEFQISSPKNSVDANILSVINGVSKIGQYQTVTIDVGDRDEIEVGNVLGIYRLGETVGDRFEASARQQKAEKRIIIENENESAFNKELSNFLNGIKSLKTEFSYSDFVDYLGTPKSSFNPVKLPDEYVAVLLVFRVFEKISYGLVMQVLRPVQVLDSVKNL